MPPSRVHHLLTDLRDHQEYLRGLRDLLYAWCHYPDAVTPLPVELQAIVEARTQLETLYTPTLNVIIRYAIKTKNGPVIYFLNENRFEAFPLVSSDDAIRRVQQALDEHRDRVKRGRGPCRSAEGSHGDGVF